jgi:hypothetical protein
MRIDVIFKDGPYWDPDKSNVVFHHINHGVPEEFMKNSLNWLFGLPILTINTEKSQTPEINWTTQIHLNETAASSVAAEIKKYYEENIIPQLSKLGYNIEVDIKG